MLLWKHGWLYSFMTNLSFINFSWVGTYVHSNGCDIRKEIVSAFVSIEIPPYVPLPILKFNQRTVIYVTHMTFNACASFQENNFNSFEPVGTYSSYRFRDAKNPQASSLSVSTSPFCRTKMGRTPSPMGNFSIWNRKQCLNELLAMWSKWWRKSELRKKLWRGSVRFYSHDFQMEFQSVRLDFESKFKLADYQPETAWYRSRYLIKLIEKGVWGLLIFQVFLVLEGSREGLILSFYCNVFDKYALNFCTALL